MRLAYQIQRAAAFDMAVWSKVVASLIREVKARENLLQLLLRPPGDAEPAFAVQPAARHDAVCLHT